MCVFFHFTSLIDDDDDRDLLLINEFSFIKTMYDVEAAYNNHNNQHNKTDIVKPDFFLFRSYSAQQEKKNCYLNTFVIF